MKTTKAIVNGVRSNDVESTSTYKIKSITPNTIKLKQQKETLSEVPEFMSRIEM